MVLYIVTGAPRSSEPLPAASAVQVSSISSFRQQHPGLRSASLLRNHQPPLKCEAARAEMRETKFPPFSCTGGVRKLVTLSTPTANQDLREVADDDGDEDDDDDDDCFLCVRHCRSCWRCVHSCGLEVAARQRRVHQSWTQLAS